MQLRVTNIVGEVYFSDFSLWEMGLLKEGRSYKKVLQRAADLGTLGHECVENKCLVKGAEKIPNLVRMNKHLQQFLKDFNPEYIESEIKVLYTGEEGIYTGHIDLIVEMNGEMWILDTKTHGLYKPYEKFKKFTTMTPDKKAKVNLQTWLYSKTENGRFAKYKRGVLHINQYGYEILELKRKPSKEVMAEAMNVVQRHKNATIF